MLRMTAALACLAASLALAAPPMFSSRAELVQWFTYYYQKPEPAKVGDAMAEASRRGLYRGGTNAPPWFGFLAGALAKSPMAAAATVKRLATLPEEDQPIVVFGIWYSGLAQTKPLLQQVARDMPAQKGIVEQLSATAAPRMTDIPLEQGGWVLDMLWGNFIATGDETPILRVISALPWSRTRGNSARMSVGGSARWSLTANAALHPRVMEICRRQAKTQPPEVARILEDVIRNAEDEIRTKGRPGPTGKGG
jgi:hypothetical protein